MKVTQFGPGGLPLALAGWSTGVVSVNSNFHTNDGGFSATNFVQGITANGSNMLSRPIANIAAGSNILLTLDAGPGNSIPSNTVRIHSTGGGAGGNIITSNGSNSLAAVVNLKAGTGIALGVSGQDITITNTGSGGGGGGSAATGARYMVQAAAASGSASSTTRTATLGTAPTNGNYLIAVTLSEGTDAVSSVVTTNVTWSLLAQSTAGVAPVIEIWKGSVAASAGTGTTVTWGASTFHNVVVMEWSGLSGTLDQNAQRHGTDGANTVAIIAPTVATALVISGISTTSNSTTFGTIQSNYLVPALQGQTVGVYWGFPNTQAVYGIATGGSSNTFSSCTVSLT